MQNDSLLLILRLNMTMHNSYTVTTCHSKIGKFGGPF